MCCDYSFQHSIRSYASEKTSSDIKGPYISLLPTLSTSGRDASARMCLSSGGPGLTPSSLFEMKIITIMMSNNNKPIIPGSGRTEGRQVTMSWGCVMERRPTQVIFSPFKKSAMYPHTQKTKGVPFPKTDQPNVKN